MALEHVSPGDPHAVSHNEERDAINALAVEGNKPSRQSDRAYFYMHKALLAGDCTIVAMGDSKTEGTSIPAAKDRWLYKLQENLRKSYSSEDKGFGYIPAVYNTAFPLAEAPVVSGTTTKVTQSVGLGTRSLRLQSGSSVTFKPLDFTAGVSTNIHWVRQPGGGELEVVVGGTVLATIVTEGGLRSDMTSVNVPAGSQEVIVRLKGTVAAQVEGIFHRTAVKGIRVIDGAMSGGTIRLFGSELVANGHWRAASFYIPNGAIMAFGANDMSDRTVAQFVADARIAVDKAHTANPYFGVIILMGTERTSMAETGKVREFEAAFRSEFSEDPSVTLLYETDLWLPTAGVDYTWGGPDGWLADSVHTSAAAHTEIAHYLGEPLQPSAIDIPKTDWGSITGKPSSFTPSSHASSHATGGSDPVTPESIGAAIQYPGTSRPGYAMPIESGPYTGHVDDAKTPGIYRVSGSQLSAANGYPPTRDSTGTLVVETSFSAGYVMQTVYSNRSEDIWTRSMVANSWYPWQRFAMHQDTGWRKITAGEFTNGWKPYVTNALQLAVRRVGSMVTIAGGLDGTESTAAAAFSLPSGFRPGGLYLYQPYLTPASGLPNGRVEVATTGTISIVGNLATASGGLIPAFTVPTSNTWPTTLPGTPA